MTSHLTISIILVFAAVALLRAFQLETKILLRGVILLFFINYLVIRTSQDYATSGKGYRDFLFKDPVPLQNRQFNADQLVRSIPRRQEQSTLASDPPSSPE